MASAKTSSTTFRVSVVGLSGKDKGSVGVGKSCLCNRFVRPSFNDYREDHISQVSPSDFSSLVINNQHFLYWGAVTKQVAVEGDRQVIFEIVEQTEFEDDTSFKTFGDQGGVVAYIKRAAQAKLASSGKLAYINKDQLALPTEYTMEDFPAKFTVDGFLIVADVSPQQDRAVDTQPRLLTKLLPALTKLKKPVVVAANKYDCVNEKLFEDVEAVVSKHSKGIPIICTSAQEAINVDAAFFLLEQLADRSSKSSRFLKFPSYADAYRARQEMLDTAKRRYQNLLDAKVTNFTVTWYRVQKILKDEPDFEAFLELAGTPAARKAVIQYVKRLKEDRRGEVLTGFQQRFPEIFAKVIPSVPEGCTWDQAKELIRESQEFERHFVVLADDVQWDDDDCLVSSDSRIPIEMLDRDFAKSLFESHKRKLHIRAEQDEVAESLLDVLHDCASDLYPGMPWNEASEIIRAVFPDHKPVPDTVALPTYRKFDEELREVCRKEFHELLLENIDVFDLVADVQQPTNYHVQVLEKHLQSKPRYVRLAHVPDDRNTLLWRVVASRQKPQLHADMCLTIGRLPSEQTWMSPNNRWFLAPGESQLNLVLLGSDQLPGEFELSLRAMMTDDDLHVNKHNYRLRLEVVNSETVTADSFTPDDFAPQGLVGIFSTVKSVTYLEEALTGLMLHAKDDDILDQSPPFKGLPIVLIYAADHEEAEADQAEVEKAGQRLGQRLQAPTLLTRINSEGTVLTPLEAVDTVSLLLDCISHRYASLYGPQPAKPDLKLALCCLENDPIGSERVLGPFLRHQCCWRPSDQHGGATDTLLCEMCFGDSLNVVQLKVVSSLSGQAMLRDAKHGYIVVHCAQRRASFNVARHILNKLPTIPKVLVSTHADVVDEGSVEQELLSAASTLALERSASRLRAGPAFATDELAYWSFMSNVWQQRHTSLQKQQAPPTKPHSAIPPRNMPGKSQTLQAGLNLAKLPQRAYEDVPLSNGKNHPRPHSIHLTEAVVEVSSPLISAEAEYAPLIPTHKQNSASTTATSPSPRRPRRLPPGGSSSTRQSSNKLLDEELAVEESEYAMPFKANRAKKAEPPLSATNPMYLGMSQTLDRVKTKQKGATLPSRLTQSSSVDQLSEYAVAFDAVNESPPPMRPNEDCYADPHDSIRRISEISVESSDMSSDVYALPHDVLKVSPGEHPPRLFPANQHHQKAMSLPRPPNSKHSTSQTTPVPRSVSETRSPESPPPPLRRWKAQSERHPSPKVSAKPRKTSGSAVERQPGEVTSPQEAFAKISEGPAQPNLAMGKGKLPKHVQKFQALRWSRPVSSHQVPMTSCTELLRQSTLAAQCESDEEPKLENGVASVGQGEDRDTYSVVSKERCASSEHEYTPTIMEQLAAEERALEKVVLDLDDDVAVLSDSGAEWQEPSSSFDTPPPPPPPPPSNNFHGEEHESPVQMPGLSEALRLKRKRSLTNITLLDMKTPLVVANLTDSDDEAPPPVPPKNYSDSDDQRNPSEEEGCHHLEVEEGEGRSKFAKSLRRKKESLLRSTSKGEKDRRRRALKEQKEQEKRTREEEKKREKRRRKEEKDAQRKTSSVSHDAFGKSYFGVSLEELPPRPDGKKFPLFVEVCVDFIEKNGMTYEGIYRVPGSTNDVSDLQNQFARDPERGIALFDPCVTVVASALKAFLRGLPEPLVPTVLLQNLLDTFVNHDGVIERQRRLRQLLTTGLAPLPLVIVEYFCRHLNRVAQHSDENKMAADNLSIVIWPSFFRPDISAATLQTDIITDLRRILTFLINHTAAIFGSENSTPSVVDHDFDDGRATYYASTHMDKIPAPHDSDDDSAASYATVRLWNRKN